MRSFRIWRENILQHEKRDNKVLLGERRRYNQQVKQLKSHNVLDGGGAFDDDDWLGRSLIINWNRYSWNWHGRIYNIEIPIRDIQNSNITIGGRGNNILKISAAYIDLDDDTTDERVVAEYSVPDHYPGVPQFAIIQFEQHDSGLVLRLVVPWKKRNRLFVQGNEIEVKRWVNKYLRQKKVLKILEQFHIDPHDLLVSQTFDLQTH